MCCRVCPAGLSLSAGREEGRGSEGRGGEDLLLADPTKSVQSFAGLGCVVLCLSNPLILLKRLDNLSHSTLLGHRSNAQRNNAILGSKPCPSPLPKQYPP